MNGRLILAAGVATVAVTLAGCASSPESLSGKQAPRVPPPTPAGANMSAVVPAPPNTACERRQSYRPRGPLPPPGAMPAGSTMAAIHDRGRLIVGVGPNAFRLSYRDSFDGQVKGFEADIAWEIAEAIFGDRDPGRIQFRATNTAERIPTIQAKQVDLALAAMTMTCDRWQQIAFSAEYFTGGQRVLVNRDSPVRSMDDLGGKKVCASETSTNIITISRATSHPVPVSAANTSDCLLMLQQGQVDAVSTGDMILVGLAAQDPGTKIVGPRFTDEPTAIGLAQDSTDLVRFVNGVLERLLANGKWAEFMRRWFADIPDAPQPVPQYKPE